MFAKFVYVLINLLFLGALHAFAQVSAAGVDESNKANNINTSNLEPEVMTENNMGPRENPEKIVNYRWVIDTSKPPENFEECFEEVCLNKGDTIFIKAESEVRQRKNQNLTLKIDRDSTGEYDHKFDSIESVVRTSSDTNNHVKYLWMKFIDESEDSGRHCREISVRAIKLKDFLPNDDCTSDLELIHQFMKAGEAEDLCKNENLIHWRVDDANGCGEVDTGLDSAQQPVGSGEGIKIEFLSPPEPGQGTGSGTQ